MAKKITKERARELREQQRLRKKGTIQPLSRTQKKQKIRKDKKTKWKEKLIRRGGFIPKRAKRWGDPCDYSDCPQWDDGECAYEDYSKNGCFMKKGKK